jgi:hypothetical protein
MDQDLIDLIVMEIATDLRGLEAIVDQDQIDLILTAPDPIVTEIAMFQGLRGHGPTVMAQGLIDLLVMEIATVTGLTDLCPIVMAQDPIDLIVMAQDPIDLIVMVPGPTEDQDRIDLTVRLVNLTIIADVLVTTAILAATETRIDDESAIFSCVLRTWP